MNVKGYWQMRNLKKLQHYLCECETSWRIVFTGTPEPPVDMESTTILPKRRVTPIPESAISLATSSRFLLLCKHRLAKNHLSTNLPRGFRYTHEINIQPVQVIQTRRTQESTNVPAPATAAAAAGNVPSPQELSAERNAPPIVPSDICF
jgi:hypothetical protein